MLQQKEKPRCTVQTQKGLETIRESTRACKLKTGSHRLIQGLSHSAPFCENDPFKTANVPSLQPPCTQLSQIKSMAGSMLLAGFSFFHFIRCIVSTVICELNWNYASAEIHENVFANLHTEGCYG